MDVRTLALGRLSSFGGGRGCGLFDGEGLCGSGGWEVVGRFVLGLVPFVLVWHCGREVLVRLQLSVGELLLRY